MARINGNECVSYIQLQYDLIDAIYGKNNISMIAFNYHDVNQRKLRVLIGGLTKLYSNIEIYKRHRRKSQSKKNAGPK